MSASGNGYNYLHMRGDPRADKRGRVYEHIVVAERALGKRLPKDAVVHHVNGNKLDNRPENLVICESQAYHRLLHERKYAYEMTGFADAQRCGYCKGWGRSDAADFYVYAKNTCTSWHRSCRAAYDEARYRKNRTVILAKAKVAYERRKHAS